MSGKNGTFIFVFLITKERKDLLKTRRKKMADAGWKMQEIKKREMEEDHKRGNTTKCVVRSAREHLVIKR